MHEDRIKQTRKWKCHALRAGDRVYGALYAVLLDEGIVPQVACRLADAAAEGRMPLSLIIKEIADKTYKREEHNGRS